MAITNGSTISTSDLQTAFNTPLSLLRADAQILPSATYLTFNFDDITSATSTNFRSVSFVASSDYYLEDISIAANNISGTVTVGLSAGLPVGLGNPISISVTGSVGSQVKATRYYSTTTNPFLSLLQGVTYTLTVSTTDAAIPAAHQSAQVVLCLRSVLRRS